MAGGFSAAGEDIIRALGRALEEAAYAIMEEADTLVPKDTQTLRGSAEIFPLVSDGERLSISFGYGYGEALNPKTHRTAAEYAVPVHEILSHHHEPPTTAKFLEIPVFAYASEMERDLGQRIEAELVITHAESL